jgi:hypothetical protein
MAKMQTFIKYVNSKVVECNVFGNNADYRELEIQFQNKTDSHVQARCARWLRPDASLTEVHKGRQQWQH